LIVTSHQWIGATSLNNLPRIDQRREVETDNIHLSLDSIVVLNHGANDGILDFAVMKVHADFVADLELPIVWLLWGWHTGNLPVEGAVANHSSRHWVFLRYFPYRHKLRSVEL
jgi:hypothetical protein